MLLPGNMTFEATIPSSVTSIMKQSFDSIIMTIVITCRKQEEL